MRAVVAFFGLPRCSPVCWPSIERRLMLAPHRCIQTGRPRHQGRFLAYAISFAGARVHTFDQRASRVRVDGSLAEEDFEGRLSPLVRTGPRGP